MKTVLTAMSMCLLASASFAYFSQTCGTSIPGGVIAPGTYSGGGATQEAALANLLGNMGITLPTCSSCGDGCSSTYTISGFPPLTIPNPVEIEEGTWVCGKTVNVPRNWDQTCTSCLD